MSDLISKSKLLQKLTTSENGERYPTIDCDNFPVQYPIRDMIKTVRGQPTVDAIPVIHCKDCRYLGIKGLGDGYCRKKMAGNISPYDFCSYGERKEPTHE